MNLPNCAVRVKKDEKHLIFREKDCNKPVKYKATWKEGVRGREVQKYLCGTHFRALQMNSNAAKKRLGYDSQLQWEKV